MDPRPLIDVAIYRRCEFIQGINTMNGPSQVEGEILSMPSAHLPDRGSTRGCCHDRKRNACGGSNTAFVDGVGTGEGYAAARLFRGQADSVHELFESMVDVKFL